MSCRYGVPNVEEPVTRTSTAGVGSRHKRHGVRGQLVQGEEIAEICRTRWGSSVVRFAYEEERHT
jgi:hypothetical protein